MEIFHFLAKYVQSRLLQNCHMKERVKLKSINQIDIWIDFLKMPFPHWGTIAGDNFWKELRQKEKLLRTSKFFFCHNVFKIYNFIYVDFPYFSLNIFQVPRFVVHGKEWKWEHVRMLSIICRTYFVLLYIEHTLSYYILGFFSSIWLTDESKSDQNT